MTTIQTYYWVHIFEGINEKKNCSVRASNVTARVTFKVITPAACVSQKQKKKTEN